MGEKKALAVATTNSSLLVDRVYQRYKVYASILAYNVNTHCSLLGCKKKFYNMISAFVSIFFSYFLLDFFFF